MKKIFRYITGGLLAATIIAPANAQELRSSYFLQTSNFRHQMNPALLDAPYVGTLFSNINVGATGNVGLSNFVYKLDGNPKYDLTTFMSPTVSAEQFLGDLKEHNKTNLYLNYNIASIAFNMFKGVSLVEVNLRSNTNINLPKSLFEFMKTAGAKDFYHIEDLGIRSQNYVEIALGHSRNITNKLRVGAKVKFLLGAAYADFSADQMDITMNGDQWRIQGDAKVNAAIMKSTVIENHDELPSDDHRYRVDDIDDISFGIPGKGFAVDLGATYQVTKDLTVSAAVTDLGFIKWKDTHKASSKGDYLFNGFENIHVDGQREEGSQRLGEKFDDMKDDLENMFAVYNDGDGEVSQSLATTINVGAEYTLPVYRPLRFGFLYTGRVHGIYSWHQGMFSANIRPLKWIEAAVNVGFSSTGTTFGSVLSLKAKHFNFYIGADSFLGDVSKEFIPLKNMNANINLGMTIPL